MSDPSGLVALLCTETGKPADAVEAALKKAGLDEYHRAHGRMTTNRPRYFAELRLAMLSEHVLGGTPSVSLAGRLLGLPHDSARKVLDDAQTQFAECFGPELLSHAERDLRERACELVRESSEEDDVVYLRQGENDADAKAMADHLNTLLVGSDDHARKLRVSVTRDRAVPGLRFDKDTLKGLKAVLE